MPEQQPPDRPPGAGTAQLVVRVHPELVALLRRRHRASPPRLPCDPAATLGHLVQSLGLPLTEVGRLRLDGEAVSPRARAATPGTLRVEPVSRPQPAPTDPPGFLLDVHLGSLARRLRLLGLDVGYGTHAEDAALVARANAERRVLLTRDRGLLGRRTLLAGAFVRGTDADAQSDDVLDRFAPPLAPWTRCAGCGGRLAAVGPELAGAAVRPGTLRSYRRFSRCTGCGATFWRGAHAARLERAVERGRAVVAARRGAYPRAGPPTRPAGERVRGAAGERARGAAGERAD